MRLVLEHSRYSGDDDIDNIVRALCILNTQYREPLREFPDIPRASSCTLVDSAE